MRHVVAILALPFTVMVLVPLGIWRRGWLLRLHSPGWPGGLAMALGLLLLLLGLCLFVTCLRHFAREGRGTLAPWAPPVHLVVSGPYRYVRNPMISAVVFILFGEAGLMLSGGLLGWATLFLLVNLVYLPLWEEGSLEKRFGAPYRRYRQNVPRFLPRWTPWDPV